MTHDPGNRIRKLRHLVTRSSRRELLQSRSMRPMELMPVGLSPLPYLLDRLGRPMRARAPKLPPFIAAGEREETRP
jgi:hypothetical protein